MHLIVTLCEFTYSSSQSGICESFSGEIAQNWFFDRIAQSTSKYKSVHKLYINQNEKYFLKLQYLKQIKSYHVN